MDLPIRVLDPVLANLWYVVSGGAALVLTAILLASHVFEHDLADRTHRLLNLAAVPLFIVFAVYVLARPLL